MHYFSSSASKLQSDHIFANAVPVEGATVYHAHNFIEIAYVAEGEGKHTVDGHEFPVKAGDLTVINYDVPHAFACTGATLLIYNCLFTPVFFDRSLSESRSFLDLSNHFLLGNFYQKGFEKAITVHARGADKQHLQHLYEEMFDELDRKRIGYRELMRSYLIDMLITVFRINSSRYQSSLPSLSEAIEYTGRHFHEHLHVEQLAEIACCSKTVFCRKFKRATGMNVTEYIQTLRVEEACSLLFSTDRTVESIASSVGYEDMKHFYEVFERITGKRPKEYRSSSAVFSMKEK